MSKRRKRLEKLRRNPKNARRDELDIVLRDFGFESDFTAGSHVTYRHPSGVRITVAAHGPHVASYIVKQAVNAIDEVINDGESDDEEEAQDEQND